MSLIWCTLGIGSLNASQGILICGQGWPTWLGHEEGRGSRKVGNRKLRCRGTVLWKAVTDHPGHRPVPAKEEEKTRLGEE